jgi:hypothetical protein
MMRARRFFPFVVTFVVVCLVARLVSFASATVIFTDGFESGNFSAWTGVKTYSPEIVSDVVHDGSYAAFCNDTGIRVCYKEVTPVNHLFIRGYYKFGAMSVEWAIHGLGYFVEHDMVQIVAMFAIAHLTGSTYIWWIQAINGTDLQNFESSSFTLDVNHWYCMELEMFVDGSAGYTKLYVDGVLAASLDGVDNDYYGPIGRAGAGQVFESRNNEPVWWDSCVIADSYIGLEPPRAPDINGDGKVSLADLVILANAYGSKLGDTKWNPNADINGDNIVDLSDLVILANYYGQHYP